MMMPVTIETIRELRRRGLWAEAHQLLKSFHHNKARNKLQDMVEYGFSKATVRYQLRRKNNQCVCCAETLKRSTDGTKKSTVFCEKHYKLHRKYVESHKRNKKKEKND